MSAPVRPDADARAARRFGLAGLCLLALSAVVGTLGALVQTKWAPLIDLDEATTRRAERLSGLVEPARLLTHLGDPWLVTLASAALALGLVLRGERRLALFVVVARLGAAVLSSGIKAITDRARPVFEEPVASAYGSSFPSGHTLGATGFWLALAVVAVSLGRSRWWLLPAAALALVVAATRVLLGVHYLSDVTAGLVLGAGWVILCTVLFAVWSEEEGRPVELVEDGLGSEQEPGA